MSRFRNDFGEEACRKCHGEGVVEDRQMGVITPDSPLDENSGMYVCHHCHGDGREPGEFGA